VDVVAVLDGLVEEPGDWFDLGRFVVSRAADLFLSYRAS